jgi:hypothetical protein
MKNSSLSPWERVRVRACGLEVATRPVIRRGPHPHISLCEGRSNSDACVLDAKLSKSIH